LAEASPSLELLNEDFAKLRLIFHEDGVLKKFRNHNGWLKERLRGSGSLKGGKMR